MQGSYQAPVLNQGYYDVPIQNSYSNPNPMSNSYPSVSDQNFNNTIQNNYPNGGYTVQPSNVETFVGSRESTYKYVGNSGYQTNPYMMSISHSNDQFPAQVYTNTGVQLRVDPRMSSSKIEDSAYKAKTQMMGGGYAQQFMPNNPFTMPQMGMNYNNPSSGMGMNGYNPSSGMGMWSFEPPYAEPTPTFPAVPAQIFNPMMSGQGGQMMMGGQGGQMMMGGQGGQMMMGGGQRATPSIRIKDDEDEDEEVKVVKKKSVVIKKRDNSTVGKINSFLTDNSTIYWLVILLVILIVAFIVKAVYVDK